MIHTDARPTDPDGPSEAMIAAAAHVGAPA